MKKLIEVRTYRLKPGTTSEFHEAMTLRAIPLLEKHGIDVVAFGESKHEHESYFLIRVFDNYAHLVAQQDAFYSSAEWRKGPREVLINCIETYLNTLLWLSAASIDDLRTSKTSNVV